MNQNMMNVLIHLGKMKKWKYQLYVVLSILIFFTACQQKDVTAKRLENWLNNIASKDMALIKRQINQFPDSVYKSFQPKKLNLNKNEFLLIKKINSSITKSIQLNKNEIKKYAFLKSIEKIENEQIKIKLIPVNPSNPLKYYLLEIDQPAYNERLVQFYSQNQQLGEYKVTVKSFLETTPFDDSTLIIGQIFQTGTGVYWLQNHFFQFTKKNIHPVLQTVSSSYVYGWNEVDFGIHSSIISKQPLKISYEKTIIIKDSLSKEIQKNKWIDTILFMWNNKQKCYQAAPTYQKKYENNMSFYLNGSLEFLIHYNPGCFKSLLKSKKGTAALEWFQKRY